MKISALGSRTKWAIVGAAVSVVAVLLITSYLYFFARFIGLEEEQSLADNDAIARGIAAFIQAREEGHLNTLRAYAGRFAFRQAVKRKDRAQALVHLRQLRDAFPDLDRPFLTDPAGVIWAIYPEAPESLGRSFADRDWYQGVSREWRPYMSEVYAQFRDRALAVALAVPIRDPDDKVIGIIVSPQRLEVVRRWLLSIEIPEGDVYVVDRRGQFVFHRTRTGPDRLSDYVRSPAVERLLRGEEGVAQLENRVDREVRLTAYRRIPSLGWGVVVHRSKNLVLQRTRALIAVSGVAGLLFTVAIGGVGVVALRSRRRAMAALVERNRSTEELRRANAFLDSVLENIPNMIFVKDARELRFVRFNRAGEELLGYPREALMGKNDYDFFPKDEADFFTGRDRDVLRGRKLAEIPEEPIHTAHKGTRFLRTKKIPILDKEDRPQYLLGISEDITERKEAEEALRRATKDAEEANRAKSEFLSRMSHELRTPLNAILGFAQLLELEAQGPADRESVEQILKGGRHLLGLINEVLDIARIEAGQLPLSPEPVRVGDAVQCVLDLARPLATGRGIELLTAGAALHAQHVWADAQRLQQVLLNLVSNGIKYNREGGKLTVACDAAHEGRLRISVTDTGAGFPPAFRERLFQPFDRLDAEQRGVEGTGLGLVLSKRLVEAMGGTIGVESVLGEGSTFWVEFPQVESPVERLERVASEAVSLPVSTEQTGTLLYVEDNLSNLRLVERTIALRPGLKLIPAMQGRLGLDLARQHRPDLILLDVHLPDISGEQVLRELRADPELGRTPVVVLSADATPGQVQRLLAAGARAYLTKPLDVRRLLTLLDETLPARGPSDG